MSVNLKGEDALVLHSNIEPILRLDVRVPIYRDRRDVSRPLYGKEGDNLPYIVRGRRCDTYKREGSVRHDGRHGMGFSTAVWYDFLEYCDGYGPYYGRIVPHYGS